MRMDRSFGKSQMIKPMIHRLWLGPNQIPDEYIAYGLKWQELNPDWQVIDWDQQQLSFITLRNQHVISDIWKRGGKSIEAAVQVADVVGYELIYHYGGIYVNVDIEPIRSLDYMFDYYSLSNNDVYAGREDWNTPRIVNAVLGGPLKHPFWEYVIKQLAPRYFANPEAEMVETTGPALLTDCVNEWNNCFFDDAKVRVLDHKAFNLVHWSRIPLGENADEKWIDSEEVVGVHHWGHRKTGRTNIVGVI